MKKVLKNISEQFGLHNIVNFTNREDAMSDLMLTDIADYKRPSKLAPLASKDLCSILLDGQPVNSTKYQKILKRKFTPQWKNLILADIARETWDIVFQAHDVNDKVDDHSIILLITSSINTAPSAYQNQI